MIQGCGASFESDISSPSNQSVNGRTGVRRRQWVISLAATAVVVLALWMSTSSHSAPAKAAQAPLWVNSLTYGSVGAGFWWDPGTGQIWTTERGWHAYSPKFASPPTLWVNYNYGNVGGGFYLDPLTGYVWTADRGWHQFSPRPVAPLPIPTPVPPSDSYNGLESVTVLRVLDNDKVIIQRRFGRFIVDYGVGCLGMWRYEGRTIILASSSAYYISVGSNFILPSGDTCHIWGSDQI